MSERTPTRLRAGRKVLRTLYVVVGDEPSDDDRLVGLVDTPELAAEIVGLADRLAALVAQHRPPDETVDADVEVREAMRGVVAHDLADEIQTPSGHWVSPVKADGSREHADDCRGCKLDAAINRLVAQHRDTQEALTTATDALKQVEWWGNGWEGEIARAALAALASVPEGGPPGCSRCRDTQEALLQEVDALHEHEEWLERSIAIGATSNAWERRLLVSLQRIRALASVRARTPQ